MSPTVTNMQLWEEHETEPRRKTTEHILSNLTTAIEFSAQPTQPDTTAAMTLAPQPFYYNGGFPLYDFHSTLDNASHSSAVLSSSVFPNSSPDQQATPFSIRSILREDDARRSPQPTTSHFADELTPTVSRPLPQPEAVTSVDTVPLRYLHSTWLTGPFKDLWSKWKISTLRTTNVAEAFHSVLKKILKCDHPELGKLIEVFQDINLKTDCLLRSKRLRPDEMKRLRRRDADRRHKIDRAIIRFAARHHSRGVTSREVRKFCIKMSRHVTGKAI
ncbi:hypothetical protein Q1695_003905 [Nippostrongylus brasiliensis]|nr:hypothetical protein Q1695_003905 [Nippostrongylus brasiliensis]